MGDRQPALAELFAVAAESNALDIHTSIPCKVVKYDESKQLVDCKPTVKRGYLDEGEKQAVESLPVVTNVPVHFPGGGGFAFTFPIAVGDPGVLNFFECSVDRWLSGDGSEVDPEIYHAHARTDAYFTPGVRPTKAALKAASKSEAWIGTDGADDGSHVKIHLEAGTITIGDKLGSDYVALAAKVKAELDKIVVAHNTHKHASFGSVPDQLYTSAAVAATQAKAK